MHFITSALYLSPTECTKKKVDLVFLFDGSESMTGDEFNKNKGFILDIIKLHQKSSIKVKKCYTRFLNTTVQQPNANQIHFWFPPQFAAVQFSKESRTVFDFNDYQKGTAEGKLRKEQHFQSLTNTHKAIDFVLCVT